MTDDTGAFCRHARPRRPGRSAGPLTGLTFAAKDIIAIEGVTPCFGNPTWLHTHFPAARDAHSISLLLHAGANLDGITITDWTSPKTVEACTMSPAVRSVTPRRRENGGRVACRRRLLRGM